MIHELRTYTLHPGKLGQYLDHVANLAVPIRGDRFGKLLGYWSTELGTLNQVVHLWEHADFAARTAARAALAKHERWVTEYLPATVPSLLRQETMILIPVDWYPFRPASGMGVYELRSYRAHPGKAAEWLGHFREAMPARQKYSSPVAVWSTEIGPLNTVVHLWGYRDANHRAEVRKAALADPLWQAFVQKATPLLQTMETTLLVPASFSPLR
jgi:hypothetical protein